jgi:tetratricopeptide (TPR) repeat protein
MRILILMLIAAGLCFGDVEGARARYQRADYAGALKLLSGSPASADTLLLTGQCHYYLRDYRKAIEALERAEKAAPKNAAVHHWLGRAWGRRAESANPFQAPGFAVRARKAFEQAVALDPAREEAVSDLIEYYLEAPGFLGGGVDKALALAEKELKTRNLAQFHYVLAQISRKRKQDDAAERELRRAVELEPASPGRLADLALFIARRGRLAEAEELFAKAARLAPKSPGWRFSQARMYVEAKVKPAEVRRLLEEYLQLPLTPDDPSREEAKALLARLR